MSLTQITDYQERALARLAFQFKDRPRIAGILNALSAEVQEIENMFFDLLTKRSINGGESEQLDQLGVIVGQPRQGRTDAQYRIALRARIRINLAQGQPDEIIAAIKFATDATFIRLTEVFPAAFLLEFSGTIASEPDLVNIFRSVKPAGVFGALIQLSGTPFTTAFMLTFAGDGARATDDTFTSAAGLFLTRGVQAGDFLHVYYPQTESGEREIVIVESETVIRVTPDFGVTDSGIEYDVRRNDEAGEGFSNLAQIVGGELSNIVYPV